MLIYQKKTLTFTYSHDNLISENVSANIMAWGRRVNDMATLKDVAKAANVSMITVSRVINTPDKVKLATRQKTEKAMAALQYVPNVAAKNLVAKRAGVIDVYIPDSIDLSNPFVMHFIAGISETLSKHMYSFLILRNREKEHTCDGYVVTGLLKHEITEFYQYAKERSRPVTLFGHTDIPEVDCIDVDNIAGAKMATEYLINMGHKKIVMINIDENKDYTEDRFEGYQTALQDHGIPLSTDSVVYAANDVNAGYMAAKDLMNSQDFTAIFCATDTIALGASRAAAELGRKVPDDISIVGFDGLGHQLLTSPHITTVQQPIFEIGKMLAQALLNRINGEKNKTSKLVEPTLIVGHSVSLK